MQYPGGEIRGQYMALKPTRGSDPSPFLQNTFSIKIESVSYDVILSVYASWPSGSFAPVLTAEINIPKIEGAKYSISTKEVSSTELDVNKHGHKAREFGVLD